MPDTYSKHTMGYFDYGKSKSWNEKCSLVKDHLIMEGVKIYGSADSYCSIAGAVLRHVGKYRPINSKQKAETIIERFYNIITGD